MTHLPSRDECLHHRVSGVETAADVIFVVVRISNAYLISRGRHDHILHPIEYTVTWALLVDFRLVRGSGLRGQEIRLDSKPQKVYQLMANRGVEAAKIYCLSMTFWKVSINCCFLIGKNCGFSTPG